MMIIPKSSELVSSETITCSLIADNVFRLFMEPPHKVKPDLIDNFEFTVHSDIDSRARNELDAILALPALQPPSYLEGGSSYLR